MENYEALKSVFGYENIKKELMLIRSWFMDESLLNNNKVMLPRGIVFYGSAGCGKTLMMREYSKSFDCKVFVVEGKDKTASEEIHKLFEDARKEPKAIIVIDEIDLLVSKDDKLERTLQQELDGMKDNGHILVLAATNSFSVLRTPLFRNGRFDRKIHIGDPDLESRIDLFSKFVSEFGVDPKTIDLRYIAQISSGLSGIDIKAVVNDAYLRNRTDMTTEDIEVSFERIVLKSWADDPVKSKDYRVAIHEVGHALMALRYPHIFSFHIARFNKDGGITKFYDVDERKPDYEYQCANISIALAGYVTEELFFKHRDIGSGSDMFKARHSVQRMIEHSGITSINDTIDPYESNNERVESESKRRRVERKVEKKVRALEKDAKKYLKSKKATIKALADIMMEKGYFTIKDVTNLSI